MFARPSPSIPAERHKSQCTVNSGVFAAGGFGLHPVCDAQELARQLLVRLVPFQAQASEQDFRGADAFAGLLRRIDIGFELLEVEPSEAFLLWGLMFPNTEKMFAAFEDVDAT